MQGAAYEVIMRGAAIYEVIMRAAHHRSGTPHMMRGASEEHVWGISGAPVGFLWLASWQGETARRRHMMMVVG